jgi:hypothetical protein
LDSKAAPGRDEAFFPARVGPVRYSGVGPDSIQKRPQVAFGGMKLREDASKSTGRILSGGV